MIRTRAVILTTLMLGVLVAPGLQAAPMDACTQQELDTLNAYFQRAYELGLSGAAMDMDTVIAFAREGERIVQQLSPDCQAAVQRVSNAMQQRARTTGRPARLPGVLYDSGSDTYTVPNSVSCGPSGCISLE